MNAITVEREVLEQALALLKVDYFDPKEVVPVINNLKQALSPEAEQAGDVDPQRDFEETPKYSEYDRSLFEEQAVEKFKYQQGGFEVVVHPEYGPAVPDEWHDKVFARVHMGGEAEDRDAGLPGWEALCLSEDQSGTVLADLIAALTPPQAGDVAAYGGYCRACDCLIPRNELAWDEHDAFWYHGTTCGSDDLDVFDFDVFAALTPSQAVDTVLCAECREFVPLAKVEQINPTPDSPAVCHSCIAHWWMTTPNDEALRLLEKAHGWMGVRLNVGKYIEMLEADKAEVAAFLAFQQQEKG